MLRLGGVVVLVAVATLKAPVSATGMGTPLMVSGSQDSAIIDANDNGQLGDDGDCVFRSFIGGEDSLLIEATQPVTATNRLRACTGDCTGGASLDSESGDVWIDGCDWQRPPGYGNVPAFLEFGATVPSREGPSAIGASQDAPQQPLEVRAARLFVPMTTGDPGFGLLCDAGGPAVQVTLRGGARVIRDISFVGNGQGPTHACVEMPFELNDTPHMMVLRDACVPITPARTVEVAVDGEPSPLTVTALSGLPPCGSAAAPTTTVFGLIALVLALLGFGAWTLGRRRTFVGALPLP